ncbi:hypothetical protein HMPREF0208_04805 [Citrobacter koseri]|nr:hypothetical protein HMPREF3220_04199 [Citrobacter koseri]KXA02515.1 hypothetical protein HMPREF3207_02377 [Citrobacter koseri]KXB39401.1 hypothetical protein HMPREF0208_04805 [Citrobacter koseri]
MFLLDERTFGTRPRITLAVKKSALDFPVSARVVSSGENDVEEENEK